jgi:hypothetical protein
MNSRFGQPRNLSGPSGFDGFPGPTINMTAITTMRLSQTTAVSDRSGRDA